MTKKRGEIDCRNDERGELDEVFASNCTVHLERMSDSQFYLGVYTPIFEGRFFIGAKRAYVLANAMEVERVPRKRKLKGRQ